MTVQMGNVDFQSLTAKIVRLAKLDTSVFDEVKNDPGALVPALIVAVVATFLAGLGGWLGYTVECERFCSGGEIFFKSAVLGTLFAVGLWIVWLAIVYVLLTQFFRAQADPQALVRTMGFAAAPLALSILMIIPEIRFALGLTSVALFFGLTTIAIQATTQAKGAQVLVANTAGFAVWAIMLVLISSLDNPLAPGIFLGS